MNYIQVWLTCPNTIESDTIVKTLLAKRLIACAKQQSVDSDYVWQNKLEHNGEVLIIMDSHEDLFDQIEQEVAALHTYETFVLQAIPVVKVSKGAAEWLAGVLDSDHI